MKATDFSITVYQGEDTLGGKTVLLSQILGQGKPVVPNMWAGLCPPCRTEMLGLQKVYDQFKDRVSFVGLDMGEYTGLGTREDGHKLIQDLKITYPIGNTEDGEVLLAAYGVRGMPTTFFIRANGDLIGRAIGEIDSDQLVKIINEELLR